MCPRNEHILVQRTKGKVVEEEAITPKAIHNIQNSVWNFSQGQMSSFWRPVVWLMQLKWKFLVIMIIVTSRKKWEQFASLIKLSKL